MATLLTGAVNDDAAIKKSSGTRGSLPKDYRPDERVEPTPKPDFPHHQYPRWIGHKFNPDGQIMPYPGNTVLSPLDPASALHRSLQGLLNDLQQQDFASLYTFLSPSSWHMTTYEGISDQIRLRNSWPADLPANSSLKACHAYVATRLADFKHGLGADIQMEVAGFESLAEGIALKLVPANSGGERALRDLRDRLSQRLGMRHPGHDNYSFHMGLAYLLRHLSEGEEANIAKFLRGWHAKLPQSFELAVPEYCVYDDMLSFRRMFYLD
ncbi:hypothetical protein LTR48_002563 [Friedmanniomyces endolithicus]|uniref:DUF1868 domain-containing protein n=1 Tax=Rachicladosporium monterosium TaxID=1507873 RepID=A0ABR0LCF9_9PEZI|nr:hypothetical protein LTR29_007562 [Friedmanniomyces endolithicus]KAK1093319.1 hypothetical protein LTR48_002563 [Friedmanniomyces endolithicus]KAK1817303.1 hypothetical protein LTR12_008285 [Friedmanniomyces endolithicus]KAK5146012.1 hypothetical protein LTR32_002335 [Rachicladosporium monterosium]